MKNYTFTLKKNTTSFDNNYNASAALKNALADNLASKYSWFNTNSTKPKTVYVDYLLKPSYTSVPTFSTYYDFDSNYSKAISILDAYGKRCYNNIARDEYDFEIDGVPVRIMDNMIQIGYHIFSTNASSAYYINLKPAVKKLIVDITIKISNYNY